MIDSPMSPAPVRRLEPTDTNVLTTHCKKCGNEIRLCLGELTREQATAALDRLDLQTGECPGGFHVEFGGWSVMWDLRRAVAEHYDAKEKQL